MQGIEKDERSNSTQQERVRLSQTMGLQEIVALGVGGTIGGAIFILVGTAIDQAGPLGALFSFALAFLVAIVIALPYAELACRFPLAGGGYAFVQTILGRHWGFFMGWAYGGAWLFIGSYVTLGFGGYLQQFLSEASPVAGKVPHVIDALLLIIGIVIINLTGSHSLARLQKFIVVLALIALIGAGVIGLSCAIIGFHGATISRFSFTFPHGISGVLETASLAFLALSGFDIIATTGEEVKNPKRTLPLAILSTLGIVLLLYLLVTAATAGTLSGHQLSTKTPLADAARQLFGATGQQLIAIAAILTTAASGNALLAATSRITFAMARDGLLPRFLTHLHPSTRAPWIAIIVNGMIFSLFALTDSIHLLATIGSALYVLQFIFPLAALSMVRYRSKTAPSFRVPMPHLILPLAFGGCLLLFYASGQKSMEACFGWLAAGLIIHAGFQGGVSYVRRRYYLKKGYIATRAEIATRKDQISRILHDPQADIDQLEAMQIQIAELKQLRAIQACIEEIEQTRSAQTRIEERKHLRSIQARTEELELLQTLQARIEGFKRFRATQVHIEEIKFLQTLQAQPSKEEEIAALENELYEKQQELQTTQELQITQELQTTQESAHEQS